MSPSERSESFQIAVGAYFAQMRQEPSIVDLGHLIREYGDTIGQDIALYPDRKEAHAETMAQLAIYLTVAAYKMGFSLREEMEIEFNRLRTARAATRPVVADPERGWVDPDTKPGWGDTHNAW